MGVVLAIAGASAYVTISILVARHLYKEEIHEYGDVQSRFTVLAAGALWWIYYILVIAEVVSSYVTTSNIEKLLDKTIFRGL